MGRPGRLPRLRHQAHRLGIDVIVDVVYNHLGGANTGDMWQFDGWSEAKTCPFDQYGTNGGIYFYGDARAHTAFAHTRFDYGHPEVRQYLRDNALLWLQQRFADGLRFDSVGTMRNVLDQPDDPAHDIPDAWSLLQRINGEIAAAQPWKLIFARVICTETHDAADNKPGDGRVPAQIWPDISYSWASKKRSTLGAALVMTAPGIPMLFMGQEFLESHPFDGDTELDWSKLDTFSGIHALYRDLIHQRRNWFNITRGLRGQGVNVYPLNGGDKVLAFHRWEQGGAGEDVVVCNFATSPIPATRSAPPGGAVARPLQQRLERLQQRLRQHALARLGRGHAAVERDAVRRVAGSRAL